MAILACFKKVTQHLLRGTEKNQETPQSMPRHEFGTYLYGRGVQTITLKFVCGI